MVMHSDVRVPDRWPDLWLPCVVLVVCFSVTTVVIITWLQEGTHDFKVEICILMLIDSSQE